jgi:hypothetical protein
MNRINAGANIIVAPLLGGGFAVMRPEFAGPSCTTGTGMEICVTYDSSVTSLANVSIVEANFNAVAQAYSNAITNNTSANPIAVGVQFGSVPGEASTSSTATYSFGSFANVAAALQPTEKALGYTLPRSDPAGGAIFFMPQAEAKVLGLKLPGNAGAYDGTIRFSSTASFGYTPGLTGSQFSFETAAEHEIDEVLGRTSELNDGGPPFGNNWAEPFDLFRYSAKNTNSFSENATAYASVDGGATDLGTFESTIAGADRSDWSSPINNTSTDAQNSELTPGVDEGLSPSDGRLLQALGYSIAPGNGGGLFQAADEPNGTVPGLTQIPSAVAEPGSLPLLAAGAGFAALMRRRKRAGFG